MKRIVAMTLLLSLCCSVATAQQRGGGRQGGGRPGQGGQQRGGGPGGGGGGPGGNSRPGSPGSSSLERAGVKLDQALPDLTIFDEKGGKFRLADVKGKHTVIVFGCLT